MRKVELSAVTLVTVTTSGGRINQLQSKVSRKCPKTKQSIDISEFRLIEIFGCHLYPLRNSEENIRNIRKIYKSKNLTLNMFKYRRFILKNSFSM